MKLLKCILLLILAAALGLGLYNLISSMPKEEESTVETFELTFELPEYRGGPKTYNFVIEYEEGMTWEEWLESDYNTFAEIGSGPTSILFPTEEGSIRVMVETADGNEIVEPSDIINHHDNNYYLN